jgi:hypothetical protein
MGHYVEYAPLMMPSARQKPPFNPEQSCHLPRLKAGSIPLRFLPKESPYVKAISQYRS